MKTALLLIAAAIALGQDAAGQDREIKDAREIVAEAQKRLRSDSQRYEGILQVLDSGGRISDKRWVSERLGSWGASKIRLRFLAPAEVKGVTLLVVNHPDRASDQWMYTPAIGRERRIALQDRSTRFFGTDFSFEDLEERDVEQYDFRLLGEEPVDGAPCWKIESKPREAKRSQYSHTHLYVRKDNYVAARVESFQGGSLARRLAYREIQQVQGIWTPQLWEMEDLKRKSKTVLRMEKLEYNVNLTPDAFTLAAIRQ
jgi:hypothetical protein